MLVLSLMFLVFELRSSCTNRILCNTFLFNFLVSLPVQAACNKSSDDDEYSGGGGKHIDISTISAEKH